MGSCIRRRVGWGKRSLITCLVILATAHSLQARECGKFSPILIAPGAVLDGRIVECPIFGYSREEVEQIYVEREKIKALEKALSEKSVSFPEVRGFWASDWGQAVLVTLGVFAGVGGTVAVYKIGK